MARVETFYEIADRVSIDEWNRERSPIYRQWLQGAVVPPDRTGRIRARTGIASVMERNIGFPLEVLELQYSLDTAYGAGLDYIGDRVKYPRPNIKTLTQVFGFSEADTGFDQAPFYDDVLAPLDERPVSDDYYRLLLRARGWQIWSTGSLPDLHRITNEIFDSTTSWGETTLPKTVWLSVRSELTQMYQIARSTELLETPAGTERLTLFDEYAIPYDWSEIVRGRVTFRNNAVVFDPPASSLHQSHSTIDGNSIIEIEWETATHTLVMSWGSANSGVREWLGTRTIQCSILRPSVSSEIDRNPMFIKSDSVQALNDYSIAFSFPSNGAGVFPIPGEAEAANRDSIEAPPDPLWVE